MSRSSAIARAVSIRVGPAMRSTVNPSSCSCSTTRSLIAAGPPRMRIVPLPAGSRRSISARATGPMPSESTSNSGPSSISSDPASASANSSTRARTTYSGRRPPIWQPPSVRLGKRDLDSATAANAGSPSGTRSTVARSPSKPAAATSPACTAPPGSPGGSSAPPAGSVPVVLQSPRKIPPRSVSYPVGPTPAASNELPM